MELTKLMTECSGSSTINKAQCMLVRHTTTQGEWSVHSDDRNVYILNFSSFICFVSLHDVHFHWTRTHFYLGTSEARLRVRIFLAALKTHWWPSAVFFSLVWLLSLWHIPIFILNFTLPCNCWKPPNSG